MLEVILDISRLLIDETKWPNLLELLRIWLVFLQHSGFYWLSINNKFPHF